MYAQILQLKTNASKHRNMLSLITEEAIIMLLIISQNINGITFEQLNLVKLF